MSTDECKGGWFQEVQALNGTRWWISSVRLYRFLCILQVIQVCVGSLLHIMHEARYRMQVFDLMGFPPCHHNKINIHVGGVYDGKEHTIRRFAENFNTKLSPNLQQRLTVENDDRPNSFSMTDLLLLHNLTGIPLVSCCLSRM